MHRTSQVSLIVAAGGVRGGGRAARRRRLTHIMMNNDMRTCAIEGGQGSFTPSKCVKRMRGDYASIFRRRRKILGENDGLLFFDLDSIKDFHLINVN